MSCSICSIFGAKLSGQNGPETATGAVWQQDCWGLEEVVYSTLIYRRRQTQNESTRATFWPPLAFHLLIYQVQYLIYGPWKGCWSPHPSGAWNIKPFAWIRFLVRRRLPSIRTSVMHGLGWLLSLMLQQLWMCRQNFASVLQKTGGTFLSTKLAASWKLGSMFSTVIEKYMAYVPWSNVAFCWGWSSHL